MKADIQRKPTLCWDSQEGFELAGDHLRLFSPLTLRNTLACTIGLLRSVPESDLILQIRDAWYNNRPTGRGVRISTNNHRNISVRQQKRHE